VCVIFCVDVDSGLWIDSRSWWAGTNGFDFKLKLKFERKLHKGAFASFFCVAVTDKGRGKAVSTH
jgi:hypothetical protein